MTSENHLYISDRINVGIDTLANKLVFEWGNEKLGAIVREVLTPEQCIRLKEVIDHQIKLLASTSTGRIP